VSKKVFIHIPKTGGLTINASLGHKMMCTSKWFIDLRYRKALEDDCIKHKDLYREHTRWRDLSKRSRENGEFFALVRNPWNRVASQYLYGKKVGVVATDLTFEQYVAQRGKHNNRHYWLRTVFNAHQQMDYVVDDNGELRCDILRTEHLDEDLSAYFEKDIDIRIVNTYNNEPQVKKSHKDMYTEELWQMVEEQCKDDIEFFGFGEDGAATKNIWTSELPPNL
jgi:hypothetical protein